MADNDQTSTARVEATLGLNRRRRPWRWMWWLLLTVPAIAVLNSLQTPDAVAPVYLTQELRRGTLRVTVTATGTLQPINQVDVGSEVSGLVADVFVDFNDQVTRGQPIAQLDTEQLEARAASVRASLAVADAALVQAEATTVEAAARAARSTELAQRNIASQQTLETDVAAAQRAVAAVASAKAQVTSARASLQEAETAVRRAVIRAPIDGMVLSRQVDPGQTVAASFQTPVLFKLAEDLMHMQLHLDVDESDIGRVREGQQASFRVDAFPGLDFEGEIIAVRFEPLTVNNVVTYETVLSVSNPELLLRPGMTATADIVVAEQRDALLVPNRALRFIPPLEGNTDAISETGRRVWIMRDGKPVAQPVQTGVSNDEFTEVPGDELAPGITVIVDIERERRSQQQGLFGGVG